MALTTVSTGVSLITPGMKPIFQQDADFSGVDLNALGDNEFINFALRARGKGMMSIDLKVDGVVYHYKKNLGTYDDTYFLILNLWLNEGGISSIQTVADVPNRLQMRHNIVKSTTSTINVDVGVSGNITHGWRIAASASGSGQQFDAYSDTSGGSGLASFGLDIS